MLPSIGFPNMLLFGRVQEFAIQKAQSLRRLGQLTLLHNMKITGETSFNNLIETLTMLFQPVTINSDAR